MSCNGCRVLRKGCSDTCVLRQCLKSIETVEAQGHATIFVAKFFGRAGLMSLLSSVPESQRPATFKSLLYEACGRTINPVFGAVGLLCTGSWNLCEDAVDTIMKGGFICPSSPDSPQLNTSSGAASHQSGNKFRLGRGYIQAPAGIPPVIKREETFDSPKNNVVKSCRSKKRGLAKVEQLTSDEVFSPSSACYEGDDGISLELTLALRKQPRRSSPCHSEADSDTTTDNLSISGRRSSAGALGLLH